MVTPGISGEELVELLQSIKPERKALYMPGYAYNIIVYHGLLEEGLDFIQRPFTLDILVKKVRWGLVKKSFQV